LLILIWWFSSNFPSHIADGHAEITFLRRKGQCHFADRENSHGRLSTAAPGLLQCPSGNGHRHLPPTSIPKASTGQRAVPSGQHNGPKIGTMGPKFKFNNTKSSTAKSTPNYSWDSGYSPQSIKKQERSYDEMKCIWLIQYSTKKFGPSI